MAGLALQGLKKKFHGQHWVLSGIDLTVAEGEFLVLVGPSGCGKSTLLRLIAGLEEPTAGAIYFNGQLVNHLPPVQRDVAMVFQDYALYPHMSVAENMGFGLKMRGTSKAEVKERVGTTARILKIEHLLNRRPAELSGGQRQRVAIGRAMIRSPRFFLFDEPLSNLDAKLRAQMRVEIAELHRRSGRTSIYVTHDQQEAMTLADRIVVLDHGQIQQIGTPLELYHKPCSRLVGTFIGSPAMNLFRGSLKDRRFELAQDGDHPDGRDVNGLIPATTNILSLTLPPAFPLPLTADALEIGIRPEDLHLVAESGLSEEWRRGCADELTANFRARVAQVEMHGHEVQLIAQVGCNLMTVRAQDKNSMLYLSRCRPGDSVQLGCRADQIHWFAGDEEGRRLPVH